MQALTGVKFDVAIDFPAIVLLFISLLGLWVLFRTAKSKRTNFDFSEMLRDTDGKPSSARLGMFVCLGISTWAIMYMLVTNKGQIDTWIYIAYVSIWSGAKVADRGIDAYLASKGMGPPTTVVERRTTETSQTSITPVARQGQQLPPQRRDPRDVPRDRDRSLEQPPDDDEPAH